MENTRLTTDQMKEIAGKAAAALVEPGMRLGLGTGSTIQFFLDELGRRGVSNLSAVPTSIRTAEKAKTLGISLMEPFEEFGDLDLAVDGADEVSPDGHLIKGGGGAHLWEKLVAQAATKFLVIVDESKLVQTLGKFPLPVEVVPFGWKRVEARLQSMGLNPKRREKDGKVFCTDSGNYILDCHAERIENPAALHDELKMLSGIVDVGLFINMTSVCLVGKSDGTVQRIDF